MFNSLAYAIPFVLLFGVKASPVPAATLVDYGYWNINVSASNAASGYRWGGVYAEYSGEPGKISHTTWLWDHTIKEYSTTTDNPDFTNNIIDYGGDRPIQVQQSVILSGENVTLVGSGSVYMNCGLGASGRSCRGSVTLSATEKLEEN
ncbi:hypothetical protein GGS23DRAFT_591185 [Durotheca rogersii]|uniref:uncharacterized protein n=1 Tax=Durotheca rogersii TaxID=419775 RepID=UPI002220E514|nr:uncharacterized protein GGS23DRAFT_591185 [Durotheca rogersii]KAI5853628.1 hypothetical protein GGS23DRAFT_591185 [Durotheca rogersii]